MTSREDRKHGNCWFELLISCLKCTSLLDMLIVFSRKNVRFLAHCQSIPMLWTVTGCQARSSLFGFASLVDWKGQIHLFLSFMINCVSCNRTYFEYDSSFACHNLCLHIIFGLSINLDRQLKVCKFWYIIQIPIWPRDVRCSYCKGLGDPIQNAWSVLFSYVTFFLYFKFFFCIFILIRNLI